MPGFPAPGLPKGIHLERVPGPASETVAKQQVASASGRFPSRKSGSIAGLLAHCVFTLAPSTPAAFIYPQVAELSKQGW